MKLCLKGILIFLSLLLAGGNIMAQVSTIKGSVTSKDDGLPMPGVNVTVKGTVRGVMTDTDGQFSLEAARTDILVFSFIGHKSQEITVGDQKMINVTLESLLTAIDEIVVVGYGTQRKSDITGAVASIKTEQLERVPQVNITQALQGNVSGLNITTNTSNAEGNSNSILIRGQNSITASTTPLIILDGIPYSGNLSDINPNDVASVEILKDASSASIYGSRASNGVILISTKKGKLGKMNINLESYYGLQTIAHLPDMMDAQTFYELKVERYGADYLTDTENEGYLTGRNTDWVRLATRTGSQMQHNLTLSGGAENSKYYISGNFFKSVGVARNDDFSRYNFRINFD
ncbi:MAG: SusC/RagA family TonB-linked outer membrane protein, partial [Bacteroidia bacterium]